MITQVLHCPYCQGIDIVRHGKSPEGKQRYRCRQCREGSGRTFLLDYAYTGQSPEVKQQIVDMAMRVSGSSRAKTYGKDPGCPLRTVGFGFGLSLPPPFC